MFTPNQIKNISITGEYQEKLLREKKRLFVSILTILSLAVLSTVIWLGAIKTYPEKIVTKTVEKIVPKEVVKEIIYTKTVVPLLSTTKLLVSTSKNPDTVLEYGRVQELYKNLKDTDPTLKQQLLVKEIVEVTSTGEQKTVLKINRNFTIKDLLSQTLTFTDKN